MSWWRKKWAQNLGWALGVAAGVYGLVYFDVVSRARASYREAEKYMEWNRDPGQKREFFERKFEREKAELDGQLKKGKISPDEHKDQLEALEFDKNFVLQESSLKYAYQWYKDTYELFSPPESKWVRLAREKATETLAHWQAELRSQDIPFEDYMFE